MPRRRFLIVGPQRSGTTVTMAAVAGHPDATTCGDELRVEPFFTRGSAAFTYGHESWAERSRSFGALFDALTLVEPRPTLRAHGMKVAVGTPELAMDLANCLRAHLEDLHVVLVRREDVVAQFASLHRAQATGVWHSWQQADATQLSLTIPVEQFTAYATSSLRVLNQLRTLRHSHAFLEASYEHTVVGRHWDELFRFLGLDECQPTWLAAKKVSPPPSDYVANYAELGAALQRIELPAEAVELRHANARAEAQLREEAPSLLIDRAHEELLRGGLEAAERLAMMALQSAQEIPPRQRRKGFEVLEATWDQTDPGPHALRQVDRLEPFHADDGDWILLAGIVRYHAGQHARGLDDLARAASEKNNERARRLHAEWRRNPT